MSTCPENDIHSIYLDGELPEVYKAEYEAHLNNCIKCRTKLEQMKKIHEAFQYDSASITLDKEFMDESFERLQSRMRYSKVVFENKDSHTIMFPAPKKILPFAIAAAAVFAFVLPVGMRSKDAARDTAVAASYAQVQPIKRTSDFAIDHSRIFNEVSNVSYPLQLSTERNTNDARYTFSAFPGLTTASTIGRSQARTVSQASNLLADDFFSPEFTYENNNTYLQVYLPTYVDFSSLGE